MSALPLNPSESFKKRNPHLFSGCTPVTSGIPNAMIRQSSKPLMNKLETEFLGQLRLFGWETILCQSVKLRLGNGVWYTPDFITYGSGSNCGLVVWEVKGPHVWEDSIIKLKVAAGQYPLAEWRLAHKERGMWEYQIVT
jgi:hypothetical protein